MVESFAASSSKSSLVKLLRSCLGSSTSSAVYLSVLASWVGQSDQLIQPPIRDHHIVIQQHQVLARAAFNP